MKNIIVVLLLTITAFASTIMHASWEASTVDYAVDVDIRNMEAKCKGDLSDVKIVHVEKNTHPIDGVPTYTMYTVDMTATCTTK
jgi:hypothetical protein